MKCIESAVIFPVGDNFCTLNNFELVFRVISVFRSIMADATPLSKRQFWNEKFLTDNFRLYIRIINWHQEQLIYLSIMVLYLAVFLSLQSGYSYRMKIFNIWSILFKNERLCNSSRNAQAILSYFQLDHKASLAYCHESGGINRLYCRHSCLTAQTVFGFHKAPL
jgi:hypothetical protein